MSQWEEYWKSDCIIVYKWSLENVFKLLIHELFEREKLAHAQSGKRYSVHMNQSLKKERHWLSNEPTVKDELTRAQLLKTIVEGRCKDYDGVNVPLKKWGWEEMLWKTFALKANQKLRRRITPRMKENEKIGIQRETWNMYDNHYPKQWKKNPKGSSYTIHPKKQNMHASNIF